MQISSIGSQLAYVVAPVLIVSAVLKARDHNKVVASFTTEKPTTLFRKPGFFWMFCIAELAIGVVAIAFASSDGALRYVSLAVMAAVFLAFSARCFFEVSKKSSIPCFCFGSISKKAPRKLACYRDTLFFVLTLLAIGSDPKAVSIIGVLLSLLVLTATIYEEIN